MASLIFFRSSSGCTGFENKFPEKAVEIVEQWAKEHPANTRQSEFLKLFPNAKIDNGAIDIGPCAIDSYYKPHNKCIDTPCEECRKNYWLSEVEDEQ